LPVGLTCKYRSLVLFALVIRASGLVLRVMRKVFLSCAAIGQYREVTRSQHNQYHRQTNPND